MAEPTPGAGRALDAALDLVLRDLAATGGPLGRQRRPTNWPVCAAHPHTHPRVAVVHRDRAAWTCPAGGDDLTPVGELDPHTRLTPWTP